MEGVGGFDLGALFALLGQKPEMAAQLDALGIPAINPQQFQGRMNLGAQMPQGDPGAPQVPGVESPGTTQAPGQAPVEDPNAVDKNSAGAAPATAGMGLKDYAGLAKVMAPTISPPVISGGVSGGVKPPEMSKASNSAPGALGALMAALLPASGANPLRVPDLGSFIRGGKY